MLPSVHRDPFPAQRVMWQEGQALAPPVLSLPSRGKEVLIVAALWGLERKKQQGFSMKYSEDFHPVD